MATMAAMKHSAREAVATKGVTTEVVTITPGMAEAWLETNTANRRPSRSLISRYAREMSEGRWRFTGDPIRFDANNTLIDGQHRLLAIVKSGVAMTCPVIYGLPTEARDVIDTGKSRTNQDVLALHGFANPNRCASVARLLLMYKNDSWNHGNMYSPRELLGVLDKHPGIRRSISILPKLPQSSPHATIAMLYFVASDLLQQPDKADAMYTVFRTGVPSYENDPIHKFRERLIKHAGERARPNQTHTAWMLFNCWNYFVKDDPLMRVTLPTSAVDIAGLKRATI